MYTFKLQGRSELLGKIDLTLAGKTRVVETDCSYPKKTSGDKILLKGETTINLHNFSLTPPKKMLGLINVDETILINFEVALNNI